MDLLRRLSSACRVARTSLNNAEHGRRVAPVQRSSQEASKPAWRQRLKPLDLLFGCTCLRSDLSLDEEPETYVRSRYDSVSFNRNGGATRFWERPPFPKETRRRGKRKIQRKFRVTLETIAESPDSPQV